MKNKKKLISALSIGSVTATVAPLALMATSCSCSNNNKDLSMFECDNVSDGDFKPNYEPLKSTSPINMSEGNPKYFEQLKKDLSMPDQEHKWGACELVDIITYLNEKLASMLGEEFVKEDIITINKIGASVKDFKIEDSNADDTIIASYTTIEDINLSLHLELPDEPEYEIFGFSALDGSIRLAWNHKVNKMPMHLFDFDPSSFLNGTVFETQTIWYMAPDASQFIFGEEEATKDWYIDMNYLLDCNISADGQSIIDLDNTMLNYRFDYTTYALLQMVFMNKPFLANLIARILPLTAGWSAYYLSQTEQLPHVEINWVDAHKQNFGPDVVYTSIAQPATANCNFVEKGLYDYGKYMVSYLPADGDSLTDIILSGVDKQLFISDSYTGDDQFKIEMDWLGLEHRPHNKYRWTSLIYENNPDFRVVPIVMTKDWITLGDPVIIEEHSVLLDDYINHEKPQSSEIEYIPLNNFENATATLEFPFQNEDVMKEMADSTGEYTIQIVDSSMVEGIPHAELDISKGDGYGWSVDTDKKLLKVYLVVNDWINDDTIRPSDCTIDFDIKVEKNNVYSRDASQQIGPFAIKYGEVLRWNNKVSPIVAVNADPNAPKTTTIKDAFQFIYNSTESANVTWTEKTCELKNVDTDIMTATLSEPRLIDETNNIYSVDITLEGGEKWDLKSPMGWIGAQCSIKDDGTFEQSGIFNIKTSSQVVWSDDVESNWIYFSPNFEGTGEFYQNKMLKLITGANVDPNSKVSVKAYEYNNVGQAWEPLKWFNDGSCVVNATDSNYGDLMIHYDVNGFAEWYSNREQFGGGPNILELEWYETTTNGPVRHIAYLGVEFAWSRW